MFKGSGLKAFGSGGLREMMLSTNVTIEFCDITWYELIAINNPAFPGTGEPEFLQVLGSTQEGQIVLNDKWFNVTIHTFGTDNGTGLPRDPRAKAYTGAINPATDQHDSSDTPTRVGSDALASIHSRGWGPPGGFSQAGMPVEPEDLRHPIIINENNIEFYGEVIVQHVISNDPEIVFDGVYTHQPPVGFSSVTNPQFLFSDSFIMQYFTGAALAVKNVTPFGVGNKLLIGRWKIVITI